MDKKRSLQGTDGSEETCLPVTPDFSVTYGAPTHPFNHPSIHPIVNYLL